MAIDLINRTPFANLRFSNLDADGREFGVVMVKLAFDVPESGTCAISDEQEPLVLTDEYTGALNETSLRYPSDLVPYKPTTDVLLDAVAYAPGGQAHQWTASVRVEDAADQQVNAALDIFGPRSWTPRFLPRTTRVTDWQLTDPEDVDAVPIRYEHAFGGPKVIRNTDGALDEDYDERNPIGCGRVPEAFVEDETPSAVPAPQILAAGQRYETVTDAPEPAGFGPIPPAWLPRRPLGGTYDQNWLDNIWPNWAPDYDFAYHNSAHPDLRSTRFLQAPLDVTLTHLHPTRAEWRFQIDYPSLSLFAAYSDGTDEDLELVLDSVFLDVGSEAADDPRAFLVLRAVFPMDRVERLEIYRPYDSADISPRRYHPCDVSCDPALLDPQPIDDSEEAAG
ncbi:DUF2169 domain-containing protein [Tateyamaria sp. syn59]|uniref:DUF2169 family type VI secretion system accessory protein n=1 Tax=Tateyamaria sp. syn59 TaxID=2576942 RepID=UPI0011BDE805|nr:DUF2169 domain-containing protein [Tateyamaria sp. syn59]